MDENVLLTLLYDTYGKLLTKKQQEIFEEYFLFNLSLREIAQNRNISYQGVRDSIKTSENMLKLFDEKLSVRDIEKLMKSFSKEEKKKKEENKNQFIYQDLEEKMKALLGTKVSINHKANNQGKIVIDYYSNEELERILYLFQSIPEENS